MKFLIAFFLFFLTSFFTLFATEYFVNSNSNPGTSLAAPWKNLSKVESKNLQPGGYCTLREGFDMVEISLGIGICYR